MTTLLSFLFVLGVLIFVHELGHFLAARRLGVRVLTFSLGFGPKILKTTRGDTEYCISAIPLGGYVKMAGESPDDPRSGAPDEFLSKTKWERFQVLIMGPVMNIVLAVVVLAIVLAQGAEMPAYRRPAAGRWRGAGRTAPRAAQPASVPGDRILTVAGDERGHVEGRGDCDRHARQPLGDHHARSRRPHRCRSTCRPSAEGRCEVGDIGVLPDHEPDRHGSGARRSGRQGGREAGRRHRGRQRRRA